MFVYIGLLALLVLAPLPQGAVSPLAEALVTFSIFALFAGWAITRNPKPLRANKDTEHGLTVLLVIWGLSVAFGFFQIIPLPASVLAVLSPSVHDLYSWA